MPLLHIHFYFVTNSYNIVDLFICKIVFNNSNYHSTHIKPQILHSVRHTRTHHTKRIDIAASVHNNRLKQHLKHFGFVKRGYLLIYYYVQLYYHCKLQHFVIPSQFSIYNCDFHTPQSYSVGTNINLNILTQHINLNI